jgi:hypothetical protein
MFSMAVKRIDIAINGSTIFAFGIINPDAAIPKDKLCAKVKIEH